MSTRVARMLIGLWIAVVGLLALAALFFGLWLTKPQNVHVDRVTTIYRTVPAQPRFTPGERVYVDANDDGNLDAGTILGWRVNGRGVLVYGVNVDGWTYPQTYYPDRIVKTVKP